MAVFGKLKCLLTDSEGEYSNAIIQNYFKKKI